MDDFAKLATTIGGFATAVTVIITLVAIWHESREARFSLNTELLMKLQDQFEAPLMRASRKNAALALLDILEKGQTSYNLGNLVRVLNFFELVGWLWKRRAIDTNSTRVMFSYWYRLYWQAITTPLPPCNLSYIEDAHRENPHLWIHAKNLAKIFIPTGHYPNLEDLKESLKDEANLTER